jgi:hypothetical protein
MDCRVLGSNVEWDIEKELLLVLFCWFLNYIRIEFFFLYITIIYFNYYWIFKLKEPVPFTSSSHSWKTAYLCNNWR